MRTLIDIPDEVVQELDVLAKRQKRSRAAVVREVLSRHVRDQADRSWIERGAGFWKHRTDIGDSVEYQRKIAEGGDLL